MYTHLHGQALCSCIVIVFFTCCEKGGIFLQGQRYLPLSLKVLATSVAFPFLPNPTPPPFESQFLGHCYSKENKSSHE